jgi:guanylate kinase
MTGILIVVSGPSGAGKGTILDRIIKEDPTLKFSVSATTRSPRPGEVEGLHYHFIDRERFQELVNKGEFLECAKVHDEYYGTLRSAVKKSLDEGFDVILDIDVQGALQLMDKKEEGVYIFIAPPSIHELERRLRTRGTESEEKIAKRVAVARQELTEIRAYEYVIVNDELSIACEQLKAIISAEKCRTLHFDHTIE